MGARKKKRDPVSDAFEAYFNCISVDCMEICSIYRDIKTAIENAVKLPGLGGGDEFDAAMRTIVAKYRKV